MKAAVYYETGAPDVFRYEDVPDPECGPGMVLIDVEAISIEGGDTLNRAGGEMPSTPHIVGYQCAGTITRGRRGCDRSHGRRSASSRRCCGARTRRRSRSRRSITWPIPRRRRHRELRVRAGRVRHRRRLPVRVRPPAGGRDGARSKRARAASASPRSNSPSAPARPCSRPRRATNGSKPLYDLGLDHGIDYSRVGWVDQVRELTGGQRRRPRRRFGRRHDARGQRRVPGLPRALHHRRQRGPRRTAARRARARRGQPVDHRRVPRRRDHRRRAPRR